jgi:hypothetical protein
MTSPHNCDGNQPKKSLKLKTNSKIKPLRDQKHNNKASCLQPFLLQSTLGSRTSSFNSFEIFSSIKNINCKHLETKNLREIQRLYINWDLDPGYKKNLEDWELKYGLHDWAIWRTKINENLIKTSLFNTPFILNQNNKSFVWQNITNDFIDKENNETIQERSTSLSNKNFSESNLNFQIEPSVARFIYYYGFTKQKPLIDPESYMFYGIPRVRLDLFSKKRGLSDKINNDINTKGYGNISQLAQNNGKDFEIEKIAKIEIEDQKDVLIDDNELIQSQENNFRIKIKKSHKSSISKNDSFKLSSHPPKQLTIHAYDDQKKLINVNSIKSNKSDNKVKSKNSSIKKNEITSNNLNLNNALSNCSTNIKADFKALRANSEPAPIITGINVKEKVKAFESVAENNNSKSTPIKGDSHKNFSEKKIFNDIKETKIHSNITLFDSKQSYSITKNSNDSLKNNSIEFNKLFSDIERKQKNEHEDNINNELSFSNKNIRNNTTTLASSFQALVYQNLFKP